MALSDRLRAWWGGLSGSQRLLVGAGVPVTAAAAIVNNLRGRSAQTTPAAEAPAVTGDSAALTGVAPDTQDLLIAMANQRAQFQSDLEAALARQDARIGTDLRAATGATGGDTTAGATPAHTACVLALTQRAAGALDGVGIGSTVASVADSLCSQYGDDPAAALAALGQASGQGTTGSTSIGPGAAPDGMVYQDGRLIPAPGYGGVTG